MKRSLNFSSSDSELDDTVEVEKDSGDEHSVLDSHGSNSPSTTTQVQARKRRRGIIEKRRRDRINNSLSELRRLVPSAFEKQQGSAKLEKAEILQLTVDHLKMLHATGGKGYFEAQAVAKDYRSLGFRECLAEVARYLSIAEGREGSDSLRLRLVSHLSNYASQREVHGGLEHVVWGSTYGMAPAHLPHHHLLLQRTQARTPAPRTNGSPPSSTSSSSSSSSTEAPRTPRLSLLFPAESIRVPPNSSLPLTLPPPPSKLSPSLVSSLASLSTFPLSFSAVPLISPATVGAASPSSGVSKPYRPWGMEIGAF